MPNSKKTVSYLLAKIGLDEKVRKVLIGAFGLVLASSLAFVTTDMAADIIREKWTNANLIAYFVGGFIFAIWIVVIGAVLSYLSELRVRDILNWSANRLKRNTHKLNLATDRLNVTLIGPDGDTGLLGVAKEIVDGEQAKQNINRIVLLDDFKDLQRRFMDLTGVSDKCGNLNLRIVGTMLGTFGLGSLSLAKNLVDKAEGRPFEMASFSVPGHKTDDPPDNEERWEMDQSLYPFSARIAAGEILIAFWHKLNGHISDVLSGGNLKIKIYFQRRVDIFPAVQLWEGHSALIVCSTGTRDRVNRKPGTTTAVTDVMPVGIMLQKEPEVDGIQNCDLSSTLGRIKSHMECDYAGDVYETWTMDKTCGDISVDAYCNLYEEVKFRELAKRTLKTDNEHAMLVDCLEKLKKTSQEACKPAEFEAMIKVLAESTARIAKGTGGNGEMRE